MNKRFLIVTGIVFSLILFLLMTAYFFGQATRNIALPIYGEVNDFYLTDVNGKELGLPDLRNKVWVANFFFTTCSDICPMMTKHMAELNRSFELVPGIDLVSITVNPENDSPQVLRKYKQLQKAKKNWVFLTGPREAITDLAVKSFKLGDIKEPIFHSAKFALVDKSGLIRGYYDGTNQPEINKLFKDCARLLKEKANGYR